MKTIKESWEELAVKAIPPGASDIQLIESRRMYYAGAGDMFVLVVDELLKKDTLDRGQWEKEFQSLSNELITFFNEQLAESERVRQFVAEFRTFLNVPKGDAK